MEGREGDMGSFRCVCAQCFLDGWVGVDPGWGLGKGCRTLVVDRRGEPIRNS